MASSSSCSSLPPPPPGRASPERPGTSTQRATTMNRIAIIGGSGYTALELIRILLRHPAAEVVAVTSRQAGTPRLAELHPALAGRLDLRCEPFDVDRLLAKGVDCAFGCLPHAASMQTLRQLLER